MARTAFVVNDALREKVQHLVGKNRGRVKPGHDG
jgi:hypothetical protein